MASLGESEKLDALTAGINRLTERLESTTNQQQVIIHKTQGPTPWLAAGIAVMFCTLLMLLLFASWVIPILHDLQAWRDVHSNMIQNLKSDVHQLKEPHK